MSFTGTPVVLPSDCPRLILGPMRPTLRAIAVLVIAAVVVAGCGSSASAGTAPSAAAAPTGWAYLYWSDPGQSVALPADWTTSDPTVTPDPTFLAQLLPAQLASEEWFEETAAAGDVRLVAMGKLAARDGPSDGGTIDVIVETGDASLAAFADRAAALDRRIGALTTPVTSSEVNIPIGAAILDSYCGKLDTSPPYCDADYLVRLPDGRSLTIGIGGYGASSDPATIAAFASQVISTLRAEP
jgi:hypothetical protein